MSRGLGESRVLNVMDRIIAFVYHREGAGTAPCGCASACWRLLEQARWGPPEAGSAGGDSMVRCRAVVCGVATTARSAGKGSAHTPVAASHPAGCPSCNQVARRVLGKDETARPALR